jgi:hypothetical protein
MRLTPFSLSSSSDICHSPPFQVCRILFPSHHPSPAMCPASFHVSLPLQRAPIMSGTLLLPLIIFRHMSSHAASITPHLFSLSPRGHGPITPLLCLIFRVGLHVYAPYPSANPRGNAKGSSTSEKCRVGWAILNLDEAVIEVVIEAVGGG